MEVTLILSLLAAAGIFLIFVADRRSTPSHSQSWHRRVSRRFRKAAENANYQAVSVETGDSACEAVSEFGTTRFLSDDAPSLPVPDCDQSLECHCHYIHHEDRRQFPDRRQLKNRRAGRRDGSDDRRQLSGRRRSDWSPLAA